MHAGLSGGEAALALSSDHLGKFCLQKLEDLEGKQLVSHTHKADVYGECDSENERSDRSSISSSSGCCSSNSSSGNFVKEELAVQSVIATARSPVAKQQHVVPSGGLKSACDRCGAGPQKSSVFASLRAGMKYVCDRVGAGSQSFSGSGSGSNILLKDKAVLVQQSSVFAMPSVVCMQQVESRKVFVGGTTAVAKKPKRPG